MELTTTGEFDSRPITYPISCADVLSHSTTDGYDPLQSFSYRRGSDILSSDASLQVPPNTCKIAHIPDRTNHILRATGATSLFKKHVPAKLIQQVTGHRSVEGLCHYEKVGSTERQAASNILTDATNRSTYQEVQMLNSSSLALATAKLELYS